jgi:hypothetical protein
MDARIQTSAPPKAYLRRGHIAALVAVSVFRLQLVLAQHRQRRSLRRSIAAEDLSEHIKRDIGLI